MFRIVASFVRSSVVDELKARVQEDEARKREMRREKETWTLLRESIAFLREKEGVWRSRRIAECERIQGIDKKDRLTVIKMKRKRFGIKKISKEEKLSLGMRLEERLEIARAKENLWRHHRGPKDRYTKEEEEQALRKDGIEILEEGEGEWIKEEDKIKRMPRSGESPRMKGKMSVYQATVYD